MSTPVLLPWHKPNEINPKCFMNTEIELSAPKASNREGASQPAASRRSRFAIVAGIAVFLAAALTLGIVPRLRAQAKREALSREIVPQTVSVTNVSRLQTGVRLLLPGDVHAFEETKIYARADGYLSKWNADIGAKVEAGQVLAEIDTPELDQELNQSRATLAQAEANLALARSSAERWNALLKDRAVSQQEVDEKAGALAAREADVKAAEAAVLRFEKLASFKQVRAPFAGTVTRRFVDRGALIRAGANASALFELAQIDTLRIRVNIPQAYLRDVVTGTPVVVRVAEYPDRAFNGTILRTSGAFEAATRTLLTEIETPNRDGALFPGIHVDVQFSFAQSNPPLVVPATAVITRSDGVEVATLDDSNAIRMQRIQIGRDLGRTVEVIAGLKDGALIVTNPTDTLVEGALVKLAGGNCSAPKLAKR